jgi:hypothetical protein
MMIYRPAGLIPAERRKRELRTQDPEKDASRSEDAPEMSEDRDAAS